MSVFNWFSRKPLPEQGRGSPGNDGQANPAARRDAVAAGRRSERSERREQLYGVVRDVMVRAGVLSASYKFKVLSLDSVGQRFVVMMDLARAYASETARLSEIEAMLAQAAKARMGAVVTAVYWRSATRTPPPRPRCIPWPCAHRVPSSPWPYPPWLRWRPWRPSAAGRTRRRSSP